MPASPPGRSGTSTASTSVSDTVWPESFSAFTPLSTSSTISRKMPKSLVSASDSARMLTPARPTSFSTLASRPDRFSRKIEICRTFMVLLLGS